MHGSLRLDVARLINDGILTWQDTLHPAKPQPTDAGEVGSRQTAAEEASRS
jgi:hypothetical protein